MTTVCVLQNPLAPIAKLLADKRESRQIGKGCVKAEEFVRAESASHMSISAATAPLAN